MHLALQNIAPNLYQLWSRKKLSVDKPGNPNFATRSYHLDDAFISEISASLVRARRDIPTFLSNTPRRIDKNHKGYKASEWKAWVQLFGIPLLDQRLDDSCVENFRLLSCIYSLSTQLSLRRSEVNILDDLVVRFVRSYEDIYYCNRDPKWMSVCSINIHYLLHFPAYIRDCGPARYWWQFPMERFCGILKPMARSKSQLNTSLANSLVVTEYLNHLEFSMHLPPPSSYPILVNEYNASLSHQQLLKLGQQYRDIGITNVFFYKRCQISDDLTIGSAKSQRRGDITRCNSRICYSRPEDSQMAFGVVKSFIKAVDARHQVIRKLAWIRELSDIDIDHAKRVCSYGSEGGHCWVEVEGIRSLIGLIREGGVKFIVTNQNLFDYR